MSYIHWSASSGNQSELRRPLLLCSVILIVQTSFEYTRSRSKALASTANRQTPSAMLAFIALVESQPGIGGEVVPHQDNSFLYTEPPTCTGLWLALEDATIINGCLWAIPGSHKDGLVKRFIRDEEGVHFDRPSPSYDHKDFVSVEVKAGSLVILHGDIIHQSFENQSSKSRHAYSLHVVDTDGCKWAQDNWQDSKKSGSGTYLHFLIEA
ncbi:hypothetical protein HHK36_024523 [Tetracentron sinense]|uniref:Phytanoyl-CoA dioxygenase n=1 Tax=Tetracentron sinense TaxID=13715 RepID=A0A835D468_TETSI|nr:hypothetical protein HHK36_024523 [Tetracentron sinense]